MLSTVYHCYAHHKSLAKLMPIKSVSKQSESKNSMTDSLSYDLNLDSEK